MTTHEPLPGPAICRTCRHFVGQPSAFGECRRHAPIVERDGMLQQHALWPIVRTDDFCGDFDRAHTPPLPIG